MNLVHFDVKDFSSLDDFIIEIRSEFRDNKSEIKDLFSSYITFFIHISKIIGDSRKSSEWNCSSEEDFLRSVIKILETLISIYYLYESGFYESSTTLFRNYCELFLISIAIGYDKQLHALWANNHNSFKNITKIHNKISTNKVIPAEVKEYASFMKDEWIRCSQDYSHFIKRKSIANKINKERMFFGIIKYNCETQDNKVWSLVINASNIINIVDDIFNINKLLEEDTTPYKERILEDFINIKKQTEELSKTQNKKYY